MIEIQTARTILRPFSELDATDAFSWFSDPEVMQYVPHGPDKSLADTVERIKHYQMHQLQYGYAKWMILDRHSMKPIGDSGPMYFTEYRRFELGYRLLRAYWNQGLATEVAFAWVQHCFSVLGMENLMAFTHTKNFFSIKVLEKVGFRFSHQACLMGMDSCVFYMRNPLVGLTFV